MRPADGRLQIGRTFRRGQLCFSQIVHDLFRLPEQQHSPCLQRNELFRRILELGRLAQLHVRGSRIALVQQRLAEQDFHRTQGRDQQLVEGAHLAFARH